MRYLGGKFKIRKALGTFINERLEGRDYYESFSGVQGLKFRIALVTHL